jgi:hypothetical protein
MVGGPRTWRRHTRRLARRVAVGGAGGGRRGVRAGKAWMGAGGVVCARGREGERGWRAGVYVNGAVR